MVLLHLWPNASFLNVGWRRAHGVYWLVEQGKRAQGTYSRPYSTDRLHPERQYSLEYSSTRNRKRTVIF